MEECIELSSDSSDTIILPPDYASKNRALTKPKDYYDLSSSDDDTQDKKQSEICTGEDSDSKHIDCEEILQRLCKKYSQNSSQDAVGCSKSSSIPPKSSDSEHKKKYDTNIVSNKQESDSSFDCQAANVPTSDKNDKETNIFEMNSESVKIGVKPKESVDEALENLYKKYFSKSFNEKNDATSGNSQPYNGKSDSENEDQVRENTNLKKGKRGTATLKRKQELEEQRAQKKSQKEKEKELKEQEKALKKVMKTLQRHNSKDGCIKTIVVQVEKSLLEQEFCECISKILRENDILFRAIESFPNHITWLRKTQTLENMVCLLM
ncbi:unnamed protein product [Acanthoscelides obtectus]|uniref:Uncharacterized protein n=1 Tax=Acanthoscelides obtectus TaxID=200917 RepID=A0A9P0M077_ACAOB|nr:unnamed protein product [Acanthoscelides obtectus]CAK1660148.1 hypothetical protein AOBTE_LOCUS21883 [Acanthoscelides obtectus]